MLFETFYPDTWVDSTYQIVLMNCIKKDTVALSLISTILWYLMENRQMSGRKALFAASERAWFFLLSVVEQSAGACADVQQRCAGALYRGCT